MRFRPSGGLVITTAPNNQLSLISADMNVVETVSGESNMDVSSDLLCYRHFGNSTPDSEIYIWGAGVDKVQLVDYTNNRMERLHYDRKHSNKQELYSGLVACHGNKVCLLLADRTDTEEALRSTIRLWFRNPMMPATTQTTSNSAGQWRECLASALHPKSISVFSPSAICHISRCRR